MAMVKLWLTYKCERDCLIFEPWNVLKLKKKSVLDAYLYKKTNKKKTQQNCTNIDITMLARSKCVSHLKLHVANEPLQQHMEILVSNWDVWIKNAGCQLWFVFKRIAECR